MGTKQVFRWIRRSRDKRLRNPGDGVSADCAVDSLFAPQSLAGREAKAGTASPDLTNEGDWELIDAIDAERRGRRQPYEPGMESFGDQEPCVARRGQGTDRLAEPLAVAAVGTDSAVPLVSTSDVHSEQAETSLVVLSELSQGADARARVAEDQRSGVAAEAREAIHEPLDLECFETDSEQQAQSQFEQSLVLEADMESEAGFEDDPVEDPFDEVEDLFDFDSDDEPDSAWEDFAFDADEFDTASTRDTLTQVAAEGSLTRRQRAQQQAIELGLEFGWDEAGITVLTEIFDLYGWSQCKVSMRRELHAGMTPDELALAMEVRALWLAYPEFAMDLGWFGERGWRESARATYRSLSWPMALALVRVHDGYPDIACLEHFLCELFDDWYSSHLLQRRCRSFNLYLFLRLGMSGRELAVWPDWTFVPDAALGLEFDEEHEPGISSPRYQALTRLGLVPARVTVDGARPGPVVTSHAATLALNRKPNASGGQRREPLVREACAGQRSRVVFCGNRIESSPQESTNSAGGCDRRAVDPESDGSPTERKSCDQGRERSKTVAEAARA